MPKVNRSVTLTAALSLCLCSCGMQISVPDYTAMARESLASNYTFDAVVHYDDDVANVSLAKTGPESISMAFTSPEELEGLDVQIEGGEITMSYRELEIDLSGYDLPSQSVIAGLWEVLSSEAGGTLSAQAEGETVIAKGGVYIYNFTIEFDKATMHIKKISMPNLSAWVEITNFEYTDE